MTQDWKPYLPLIASTITWDGEELSLIGNSWHFVTQEAWRISSKKKMIIGCYDDAAGDLLYSFIESPIIAITIQSSSLKIDPVFKFQCGRNLEIFSSVSIKPWILSIKGLNFSSDPKTKIFPPLSNREL